ncbi:MAG: family 78 glycoside hydrolase catalytic domain [Clostridia bacterium]
MNQWIPDVSRAKPYCVLDVFGNGCPDALVGIPSFTWHCVGLRGVQAAYRLCVAKDEALTNVVWDSGWVETDAACAISYGGVSLYAECAYYAVVWVRTADKQTLVSDAPVRFFTGLDGQWRAPWLRQPLCESAAPMFRKRFLVKPGMNHAHLYVSGLGYFQASINGKLIGDHRLDPAWTDYSARICYVAHDVTQQLHAGENAIGVMLGNGWYSRESSVRPLFTLQMSIAYEDGHIETIQSDPDSWRFWGDGPLRSDNIYIGEIYDARKMCDGWDMPGFDDVAWLRPLEAEPPTGAVVAQTGEPIRAIGTLRPVAIQEVDPGIYVADFGQNLAGVVRLTLCETAGTAIELRFSELIDAQGRINTQNLRTAQQTDIYIARGGPATYEPRFTYHGFRYVRICGLTQRPTPDCLTAVILRNDVTVRGAFSCANELINAIQKMCVWTESDNLSWVPTDCPQRDERLGWLNDLTVRAEEALYNFDLRRFFDKFLTDIADAQGPKTGAITDTAPYNRYGQQPADGVCSSYPLLGWLLYCHYGDKSILAQYYRGMAAWTDYMARQREDGVVAYSYYGDWASPIAEAVADSIGSGAVSATTPGRLMSTGFLLYNARLMKDIAHVLDRTEDEARYAALEIETQDALNRTFLNTARGFYGTGSQGANTFMLYLDVVPAAYKTRVLDHLVTDIRARGIHTSTGNICSRYIYEVLSDNGYIDLAYELVCQTSYPSWGYMLGKGATTTWERWEYVDSGEEIGMASHCHPMYSTISAWFYRYLAGIRPLEPGFRSFCFRPYLPRDLASASSCLKTVKGDICVKWERESRALTLRITVPFNSCCRLEAPTNTQRMIVQLDGKATDAYVLEMDRVCMTLESGTHTVVIDPE